MKALRIIQVLAKICRILCIICFVGCIVGAAGCVIGLVVVPLIKDIVVEGGKTVEQMFLEKNITMPKLYTSLGVGIAGCGMGIFLAKYNGVFFKQELDAGTPFDMVIVKKMRKVAIVNIIVSIVSCIAIAIAVAIVEKLNNTSFNLNNGYFSSIGFGIYLLILSLFCEYGAEVNKK